MPQLYHIKKLFDILNKLYSQAKIFVIILGLIGSASIVNAQSKCERAADEAQRLYENGHTAEVILLLNRCLPDSIPEIEREKAYKFLALAYLAEDYNKEAITAIDKLLDLNINFKPDYTRDPEKFIKIVDGEKKERLKKRNIKRRILYIGGGTVLAAIITAIILSPGDKAQPLPDPPNPNEGNRK